MPQRDVLMKKLGFSDSAAKMYFSALELGALPVQKLASHAGISRPTAYAAINELKAAGLMSSSEIGNRAVFAAESPESLLAYVELKMRALENQKTEISGELESLRLLSRGDRPSVKMFEGTDGLRAIQQDIIKSSPPEIFEIANNDVIKKMFPAETKKFVGELAAGGTKVNALVLYSSSPPQARTGWDYRPLDLKEYFFTGDIVVYKNKIAFSLFKNKLTSVLIESGELAETMRVLFKLAWK